MTAQPDRGTSARRKIAREWLRDELTALGFTATIEPYVAAGDAGSAGDGANVVARLGAIGGDTQEWVLVGAHYDTVEGSPGANDNASGTVAALAVAKLAHDLPCRERGLIVAFFDEEELGLLGSRALAAKEARAGTNIVAVHTMDQLGWDVDGDKRFEIELPTAELFAAYEASAETIGVVVVKTRIDGSDHEAFRENGFAAAGVTEEYVSRDTSPHRHAPTDTRETVNAEYLALGTRLVGDVVARQLHPAPRRRGVMRAADDHATSLHQRMN